MGHIKKTGFKYSKYLFRSILNLLVLKNEKLRRTGQNVSAIIFVL